MVKNPQVIVNHVGYDTDSTKTAVFQGQKGMNPTGFDVVNYATNAVVYSGKLNEVGTVANWNTGYYWNMRFDDVTETAKYYIVVKLADGAEYKSFPFMIAYNVIGMRTLSDANYYFKCQRPTGEVEWADKNLKFAPPREGTWDYRGGWADATGDIGIHMSHQSQTTYFNMQQSAFSAYAFFKVNDLLEECDFPFYRKLKRRMLDEAFYGAEYIMRSHAPSGSFLQTKGRHGDAYTPVLTTRQIGHDSRFEIPKIKDMYELKAFYRKIEEEYEYTDYDYETSFRSGGGYCIATLAHAARTVYPSEFSKEEYIKTAVESYDYLYANNEKYTNDGKWNLTDEYCALDALTELYLSTREWDYIRRGEDMAQRIMDKYVAVDDTMGYLSVNGTDRPYFNASEEGMPVVNLLSFYRVDKNKEFRAKILDICTKVMKYSLHITNNVANPFGLARQYVLRGDGSKRAQFFYPHDVETAPWWQGENARLGSLATAARSLAQLVDCPDFQAELNKYADDQLNWILGLNPFDSCMMHGAGHNPIIYFFEDQYDFIQVPGGIVNGITSGLEDEDGIEYIMEMEEKGIRDNWRWAEQWIPHVSWWMYAVAQKRV